MNDAALEKTLTMVLSAPMLPIRTKVGDSFPVNVIITSKNITKCFVTLVNDATCFNEISGHPNPAHVLTGHGVHAGGWILAVRQKTVEPAFVKVEARANSLFQYTEFPVEVIQ